MITFIERPSQIREGKISYIQYLPTSYLFLSHECVSRIKKIPTIHYSIYFAFVVLAILLDLISLFYKVNKHNYPQPDKYST